MVRTHCIELSRNGLCESWRNVHLYTAYQCYNYKHCV